MSRHCKVNLTLSISDLLDDVKSRSSLGAMTKTKTRHHHGDLKRALITAGLALLEENGFEGLTLRKCAARAGVSHAAPAHHFGGLPGLIEAISDEGFRLFAQYMQEEIAAGDPSALGRLRSSCRGYLKFGLDHSGLMRVMFDGQSLAAHAPHNSREEFASYQILRGVCAPFVPDGTDPRALEVQIWSLIHGFTLLYISGKFGAPPPAVEDGPFDAVLALVDQLEVKRHDTLENQG